MNIVYDKSTHPNIIYGVQTNKHTNTHNIYSIFRDKLSFLWSLYKAIHKQTASDPYTDLQGCSKKGSRLFLHKPFNDCMMFHLLTVFPNNTADQEQY
jgi:hypothetical protein